MSDCYPYRPKQKSGSEAGEESGGDKTFFLINHKPEDSVADGNFREWIFPVDGLKME
jgi:hypothetical protein